MVSLTLSAIRRSSLLHDAEEVLTIQNDVNDISLHQSVSTPVFSSVGDLPIQYNLKEQFPRSFRDRPHYRIVFKEVCECFRNLTTDKERGYDIGRAVVVGANKGLAAMQDIGWVHRDVSAGNLFFTRDANSDVVGKIGDLEFAQPFKIFEATTSHNHNKTGTPPFMACEVQLGSYLFGEGKQLSLSPSYLHDSESMWWTLFWLFLKTSQKDPIAPPLRFPVLSVPGQFLTRATFLSSEHSRIQDELDGWRSDLVRRYVEAEATLPEINQTAFVGVHENLGLLERTK